MTETLQPPAGDGNDSVPPGVRLAEARQAQNLSAADVARQLKLSVSQVEALEAGRYDQLPGPIFVRGFIRNYARIVKLDPEGLVRTTGGNLPQAAARPETPPSREIPFPTTEPVRWPRYAAAAAAIFAALGVYEFVFNDPDRAPQQVAVVAPPSTAEATRPPAPVPVQEAREGRSLQSEAVAAPVVVETAPVASAVVQPTVPRADTPVPVAERPLKPGEKQVRLDFDRESWVEIRDRNEKVIFSQLNRPGTSQQVVGLPPLSVVVGNAHGVRMTFDDQPVDLESHTKIDVARLILQ
jgi:cytoskeleton protein RodZ